VRSKWEEDQGSIYGGRGAKSEEKWMNKGISGKAKTGKGGLAPFGILGGVTATLAKKGNRKSIRK